MTARAQPIADIVGIDRAGVFKFIKIRTSERLLDRGALFKDRVRLYVQLAALTSDVSASMLLDFVNVADLLRVHGMGVHYIELLRASKVATVRDLKHRNAVTLFNTMAACNARLDMVDMIPPLQHVRRWIESANQLPKRITYR